MEERRDAVRYDPMIMEDVRYMRRCCFRRQNSSGEFRVTIRDFYDILVFTGGFWVWPEDFHGDKAENSRRGKQPE